MCRIGKTSLLQVLQPLGTQASAFGHRDIATSRGRFMAETVSASPRFGHGINRAHGHPVRVSNTPACMVAMTIFSTSWEHKALFERGGAFSPRRQELGAWPQSPRMGRGGTASPTSMPSGASSAGIRKRLASKRLRRYTFAPRRYKHSCTDTCGWFAYGPGGCLMVSEGTARQLPALGFRCGRRSLAVTCWIRSAVPAR